MSSTEQHTVARSPRRPWSRARAGVGALVLVMAVVGCGAVGRAGGEPPRDVADAADGVVAAVAALAGVADVDVQLDEVADGDTKARDADDLVGWRATLTVQVDEDAADTSAGFAQVGWAVAAVAERAPSDLAWVVWLRDVAPDAPLGVAPSISVQVHPTGDANDVGDVVEAAFVLADARGVAAVRVGADDGWVVVEQASDLRAVAVAADRAAGDGLPVTSMTTLDRRVSVVGSAGSLAELPLAFVAEVDGWPSVTRTGIAAATGSADLPGSTLAVDVDRDDELGSVVDRLTGSTRARESGSRIRFVVSSSGQNRSGEVGEALPPEPTEPGPSASPDATGTPVPPVAPEETEAPTVAPWPDDPAAPACTGADLDVRILGIDAALGSRFLALSATNVSARPCAVQARPDLTFERSSGTRTPNVTLAPRSVGPTEPARTVVPVGASVRSELKWSAMSTSLDPDVTVLLRVQAVPGAGWSELPVDSWVPAGQDAYGPGPTSLDILDGATVEVGPWQQSLEGWTG